MAAPRIEDYCYLIESDPSDAQSDLIGVRRIAGRAALDDLRALGEYRATRPRGEVDADVAGLLAAWALGYGEALGRLRRLLAESGHPAAAQFRGEDGVTGACRLLVGGD